MKKNRIIILICCIVFIIIGIITTIFYSKKKLFIISKTATDFNEKNQSNILEEKNGSSENTIITSAQEKRVSPNARICFEIHYQKCNHVMSKEEKVASSIVNLTEEELKKIYKDWKIEEYSSNYIRMSKSVSGQCEEHYLIKEDNNHIAIYRIGADGNCVLINVTDINTQYLPEIDKKELLNGIKINGIEELNSFIENFET